MVPICVMNCAIDMSGKVYKYVTAVKATLLWRRCGGNYLNHIILFKRMAFFMANQFSIYLFAEALSFS